MAAPPRAHGPGGNFRSLKALCLSLATKSRPSRLLLGQPTLERQVLMQRKVVCVQARAPRKMGGLSQRPCPGKIGDSHLLAPLHLSLEAEVSIRRERGRGQGDRGRGCKVLHLQTSRVHCDETSDGAMCSVPASHHPCQPDPRPRSPGAGNAWRSESVSFEAAS